VTLERALEVIRLKQEADANRIITDFGVDNIQVLNGRYGPYITDGKKNAKVPKDREPKSVTLEESRALLAQAPERGKGRWGRGRRGAAAPTATAKPATTAAAAPLRARAPTPPRRPEAAHAAAPRRAKPTSDRSHGNGA
jgi:DNA topoisomerase-1